MNLNKEIPLFFAIDDSYAPFLSVALHSAVVNASPDRRYKAHVLYQDLTEENRARLQSLGTDHFAVECIPMRSGMESITDRMSNRLRCDYFTLTIYFRLFIPVMFPQYDKGIYLDSDIVVNGDIAEMFDLDIGDHLVGACNDRSIIDIPELVHYVTDAVGASRDTYINSGILLMNLKGLREAGLEERFLTLLNTYHADSVAPDQDYLNAMCHGKIHYMDECWNAMPNDARPPLTAPKLVHYNLFSKPWCYDGVQYADLFWHYAAGSGYLEEIRAYKDAYSDEQKRADGECLSLLVRHANEVPDQEITFKKLFESGVNVRL